MLLASILLPACAGGASSTDTDGTGETGAETNTETGPETGDTGPAPEGCRATPAPADRERAVLVALPYDQDASASDTWAVVALTQEGTLRDDGVRIELGRATLGEVVFTPDGSLALVPTEDGGLGVYDVNAGLVVHHAWKGGPYAGRVVMDPSGEVAWVVDGNWAENGGGIWEVAIDCATGALSAARRVVEAKLPADLLWTEGGALLAALEVAGSAAGDDLVRLGWGDPPTFEEGIDAFGDDDAIVSDAAIVGDYALLADNSAFSGIPNRVARVRLDGTLAVEAAVEIDDPVSLAPFADGSPRALVASGFGDALYVLDAAAGTAERVDASSVQLPGTIVTVDRGPLAGLALVSEVGGLRVLRLGDEAVDEGVWSLGAGLDALPGAIGVAP